MLKLNQIIAIEKGVKADSYSKITTWNKYNQKSEMFNGFKKIYSKKDEEGEVFPNESKKVMFKTEDSIKCLVDALSKLFDVELTKDIGNCNAIVDLNLDGVTIKVPATFLLFMEKQLCDIKTYISNMQVLDGTEDWIFDEITGLYKTEPKQTHRTKKIQKPIVLYHATKEHQAQTQLTSEDVVIGYWDTVLFSGAMTTGQKKKMLEKVDSLAELIKIKREEANSIEIDNKEIGKHLFNYILS